MFLKILLLRLSNLLDLTIFMLRFNSNKFNLKLLKLKCGSSSVGRASAFQAECRRFEPGLPLDNIMKQTFYITIITLMLSFSVFSQNDYRTWIKGKVLYQNTNVAAANVINNTSQQATTTNSDGEFEIEVKLNDRLLFSSVQYQIRELIITKEILQKNRIVIDVNEKVTELDEVVVTPENRQKFLDLKEEEFKRFDYSSDKSTRVVNVINEQGKLRNGINFINLYKLISESLKNKTSESEVNFSYNPSDLLREVYDDLFFTNSLGINKDKINEFLLFCDDNFPSKILLKKENEFELIDFLVKQSKKFNRVASKE